ncbi:MAG TPA: hypothetical protein PKH03_06895 [Syntrophales bacterium]|nr:hypothetical protein [Syntrophus sp. (in: bacteria)]HOD28919.1 hypothetical protein [Syntrophales bacterium]
MIYIKEKFVDDRTIVMKVDGVLDQDASAVLNHTCQNRLQTKYSVILNLEGLVHITREGRTFLEQVQDGIRLENIPDFVKLEH